MTPLTKHYLETLAEAQDTKDGARYEILMSDLDSAWYRMSREERNYCDREVAALVRGAERRSHDNSEA